MTNISEGCLMKRFSHLAVIIASLLAVFCISASAQNAEPAKPAEKSDAGYLRMISDYSLPPEKSRIFLPPQSLLEIIDNAKEEYRCKLDTAKGSMICIIPKYQRYMPLILLEQEGKKIRLRGGIEAKSAPLTIDKGTELSILKDNGSSYFAVWDSDGGRYRGEIPKGLKEALFSKTSLYDDFATSQAQKGLVMFDGKWVQAERAEKASAALKELEKNNSAKLETAKKSAAEGFLLLTDGSVLEGKYCGADSDSVFFETSDGMQTVPVDRMSNAKIEDVVKAGRIKHIGNLLSDARECYKKHDLGNAVRMLDSADLKLKSYQADPRFAEGTFNGLSGEASSLRSEVDSVLKSSNKAVYDYKVFNKAVLEKHLASGHILFKGEVWLDKKQLCKKCGASGVIQCPVCGATGQIVSTCKICRDGYVECVNCSGKGSVECPSCKGSPVSKRSCSACGGLGYFNRRSGVKGISPGDSWKTPKVKVVPVGDKVIVIPSTPVVNVYNEDPYRYVQDPCKRCNGTGTETITCSTCAGKGTLTCPKVQKCPECGGKKITVLKCEKCSGAKNIPCDACGGHGYTGSPKPE